ncbi:ATP-binding cassette domain-containing protein [bacterium]|nr:ATP-binding cassette domain-containing protein [bacterium]
MALINLHHLNFSYTGPTFLKNISFHLKPKERVCIISHNKSRKSTLLNLINRDLTPSGGSLETMKNASIGMLPQIVPKNMKGSVFDVVAPGLGAKGIVIAELEKLTSQTNTAGQQTTQTDLNRMETLRNSLGEDTEWELVNQIKRAIKTCDLKPETPVEPLSAGMKRRVLLARTLAGNPDVLLLDEPTNHLDISTIQWLEQFFLNSEQTIIFVTHDRMLLEKLATRIVEIDRGSLFNWACDYRTYMQRREQMLTAQDKQKTNLDRKLRVEETWIRQGVKARRTRNEGRVKALKQLRTERKAWRDLTGSVRMRIQEAEKSGRLVIDAENITFGYDKTLIIDNFSTTIMRGDRIGILGPNGCGKSTLLKLLLKEIQPNRGSVLHGTRLQIAYFDQLRDQLDPEASVLDSIAHGMREVTLGGKKRHVYSYLKDFLFDPADAEAPVKTLSGGERNRLLLARLFAKESNLLILDEPTNDLDSDTLELLENQLMDYKGTVLTVSHDRTFLNNVVNATLVFEEKNLIQEYAGGYDDWLLQRKPVAISNTRKNNPEKKHNQASSQNSRIHRVGSPKLSYHLKRELEELPEQIEKLEKEQQQIFQTMSESDYYLREPKEIKASENRLKEVDLELEQKMERWAELDDLTVS